MTEERTPLEQEFPHLERVFDYWTFEGDVTIHTTADALRVLMLLIISFEDSKWSESNVIGTLRGTLDAAEAAAKNAKPYLDQWEAEGGGLNLDNCTIEYLGEDC